MIPYIVILILLLAGLGAKKRKRKTFFLIGCGSMFLLVALRAWFVGVDTHTYIGYFLGDKMDMHDTEPLWQLYLNIMTSLTHNVQLYLATSAALILIPLFVLISKRSEYALFSLLIYYILPNDQGFIFVMSGMRQALAVTFILWMFFAFENKKWIWVTVLASAAFLTHNSAIVAIVVMIVANLIKPGRTAVIIVMVVAILAMLLSYTVADVFSLIENTDLMQLAFIEDYASYSDYLTGEYDMSFMDKVFLVLPPMLMSLLLLLNPSVLKTVYARMYLFGAILLIVFSGVPMISRYFMYLILLEIYLLPQLYYSKECKNNKVICIGLISVHVIIFILYLYFNDIRGIDYTMRRVAPYHFFFESGFSHY